MIVWHHQLNAHEFDQTQADSEEQGSLVCCSPQGRKELHMTERLNNNNKGPGIKKTKHLWRLANDVCDLGRVKKGLTFIQCLKQGLARWYLG